MDKVHCLFASLVVLCACWTKLGPGAAEYERSCTETDGEGHRYIPLPSIRELDQEDLIMAAGTIGKNLSIYRLSDLDEACYGRVVAIEYCYRFNITIEGPALFNWTVLILEERDVDHDDFKILNVIIIESNSSGANCSVSGRCCDVTSTCFNLPKEDLIIGVTESAKGNTHGAILLGYDYNASDHTSQYGVDSMQLLLWFVVENEEDTDNTEKSGSDKTECEEEDSDCKNEDDLTGGENESSGMRSASLVPTGDRASVIVGGVVGSLLGLAIIIAAAVILVAWSMTIFKKHQSDEKGSGISASGSTMTTGYHDVVYDE